ncbi:MAG: hypothetical protein U0271_00190 [Polyangiaceae bacterium]
MNRLRIGTWLTALALVAGCGGDNKKTENPDSDGSSSASASTETSASSTSSTSASASSTASSKPPALPPVELVAGTPAQPPDKAPTISFKAPTAGQVIPADKVAAFEIKLDLTGWDVPGGGNHVHLIIDNHPYKRVDDPKSIKLGDLDPSYTLAEGEHVLIAFPSRPTHESVKPIGKAVPVAVVPFWVGKKGKTSFKATDPILVYSRPKGANDGPPPEGGILVDFYLLNAELGAGKYSIEATLTGPGAESGIKATIDSWVPWRIKSPRDGDYSLHLVLLDKDKKPVPGAWNDTTRPFSVNTKKEAEVHSHPEKK